MAPACAMGALQHVLTARFHSAAAALALPFCVPDFSRDTRGGTDPALSSCCRLPSVVARRAMVSAACSCSAPEAACSTSTTYGA